MRLKKFIGKDVRGYMNFDINFRKSVTFLIGINGSGKTTVLKLLSGLLEPSYSSLNSIEFEELQLLCEIENGKEITIYCKKDKTHFNFKYTDDKGIQIEEHFNLSDKMQSLEEPSEYEREEYQKNKGAFDNSEVVSIIKSIQSPLFLGINRRVIEMNAGDFSSPIMEMQFRRRRRSFDDAVDRALFDIQWMVFDSVRLNARKQDNYANDFRKKVVHDSFKYYDNVPSLLSENYNQELQLLGQKRDELKIAIQELGLDELSGELDGVFYKLELLLKQLIDLSAKERDSSYYDTLLRWMINSSQLEKFDTITSYGNEYLENLKKLREPILRFQNGVNMFFKESNKELIVDGQGEIKIKINKSPKRINSIYELSSGEKQLIIMLAHLALNKSSKNNNTIFFIDEPELSLHISWQEIFVDALLSASPNTQFIIATHAPAILAKTERKEWCEDLSK